MAIMKINTTAAIYGSASRRLACWRLWVSAVKGVGASGPALDPIFQKREPEPPRTQKRALLLWQFFFFPGITTDFSKSQRDSFNTLNLRVGQISVSFFRKGDDIDLLEMKQDEPVFGKTLDHADAALLGRKADRELLHVEQRHGA